MVQVSILVVSRTATLLNRLLESLNGSYGGDPETAEILISWNGSSDDEKSIQPGRFPTQIVQRDAYHFAANMNGLAHAASGDVLVFANDDLIADAGSVDAAIDRLANRQDVGLVGARLRTSDGRLAHAGINFTSHGSPYHLLENFAGADHPRNHQERFVPAVTGAFFAMRHHEFLQVELAESFRVCGEDVLLCLQIRNQLQKQVLYCPDMSGIHDAESTRSQLDGQKGHHDDEQRLRAGWKEMMQRADKNILAVELQAAQDEAEDLRSTCLELQRHEDELNLLKTSYVASRLQHEEQQKKHLELKALCTKQYTEQSLLEKENHKLQSRVQQLENLIKRIKP